MRVRKPHDWKFVAICLIVGISPTSALAQSIAVKPQAVFALVIGFNETDNPNRETLKYADDDAIRNAMLLRQLGAEVVLLVAPDSESRKLYGHVPGARLDAKSVGSQPNDPLFHVDSPSLSGIHRALDLLNQRMQAARVRGSACVFYFFYAGHGDVESNEGYVHVQGGRLWRHDLMTLLEKTRADDIHLVVDACKSYFFVFERGVGGQREPAGGGLVSQDATFPPNVGVFLSTSAASDSHEWGGFQAGIFSHEMRSALRGAADVDRDGRITYEEAGAFIWTANESIPNARYRPKFLARPAANQQANSPVLLDLCHARGDRLHLGPGVHSHLYVEDGYGIRLMDLHPNRTERVSVLLPSRRPMFVRIRPDKHYRLPKRRDTDLAQIQPRISNARARGAEHVAFRLLFNKPFGSEAVIAYRRSLPETAGVTIDQSLKPRGFAAETWVRYSLGVGGLVSGAVGGVLTGVAVRERDQNQGSSGIERVAVNGRIGGLNGGAVACYLAAGAALGGFLVWTIFWPDNDPAMTVSSGPVSTGTGGGLHAVFRF